MTVTQAFKICRALESPDYTEDEKAYAILVMLQKQGHNTAELRRAELLNVITYLFYKIYEVKSAPPEEKTDAGKELKPYEAGFHKQ